MRPNRESLVAIQRLEGSSTYLALAFRRVRCTRSQCLNRGLREPRWHTGVGPPPELVEVPAVERLRVPRPVHNKPFSGEARGATPVDEEPAGPTSAVVLDVDVKLLAPIAAVVGDGRSRRFPNSSNRGHLPESTCAHPVTELKLLHFVVLQLPETHV